MKRKHRSAVLAFAAMLALPAHALAEVHVLSSGGFTAAYKDLLAGCELKIGQKVVSGYGASMGAAPDAIPNRLARGEPADVVILAAEAFDKLVDDGKGQAGTRVDLARSAIGLSVKAGASKPDISTVAALTKTLMEAKSIAYSASASGTYLSEELFPKLDPSGAVMAKSKKIFSERVGTIVARGEAELGFQQVSELVPIEGLDFVGTLPEEIQRVTVFSAGLAAGAKEPAAAKQLIACLGSSEAAPAIRKTGLEPIPAK
ncbi:molybdenum ABC transporter substrate-binding protein [Bosea sp. Root381]|uniref:substrate-binding domain-containing protein n=1 Tax=Bosea sp. Root381 TaxID=1736524 RepID=UPI0006FD5221|nr:substrate-binding domain-containing protein [Bosea sp. Root381]KRE07517.1 molybdenum ABC transporter substrate-binding protein [Bosea sp. Root381]